MILRLVPYQSHGWHVSIWHIKFQYCLMLADVSGLHLRGITLLLLIKLRCTEEHTAPHYHISHRLECCHRIEPPVSKPGCLVCTWIWNYTYYVSTYIRIEPNRLNLAISSNEVKGHKWGELPSDQDLKHLQLIWEQSWTILHLEAVESGLRSRQISTNH